MAITQALSMTNTHEGKHSKSGNGPTIGGLQAVGKPWFAQGHKATNVVFRIKKNSNATKSSGKASHRIKPKRHRKKK